MFPYIVGFAALAAVIVFLMELIFKGKPFTSAVITLVINALINWPIMYFLMPDFSFFPANGWAWMFFTNLAVGVIISWIVGAMNDESFAAPGAGTVLWIVALIGFGLWMQWGYAGGLCDNGGKDQIAKLFNVTNSTTAFPETNLDELIALSPDNAIYQASQSMGSSANLGSYLAPNNAPLQHVAGEMIYPVDFKVRDWASYKAAGYIIPGYIYVSATDPNATARMVTGLAIKYAPAANFNQELSRYVYMNYALPNRKALDSNLESLELDDTGKPFYTVTTLAYANGNYRTPLPDGVLIVDPQSGDFNWYPLAEVPEWVNVIWSQAMVTRYAKHWATYANWDECKIGVGETGKLQIDRVNDVVGKHSQQYQITFTSTGSDLSATELVLFDARTGLGVRYPYTGPLIETIGDLAQEASLKMLPGKGYLAQECEIHAIQGQTVGYCVLSGQDVEPAGGRKVGGYAFLPTRLSGKVENVAYGATISDAYNMLLDKLAQPSTGTTIDETQKTVQYTGTVQRIAIQGDYVYLVLSGEGVPNAIFRASLGNDPIPALTREGDMVTITARELPLGGYYIVLNIVNPSVPVKK